MKAAGREEAEEQQRWRPRANNRTVSPTSHHPANRAADGSNTTDADGHATTALSGGPEDRQSLTTPTANANGSHRQVIGNYELGRVLATGDFDCRTRLCTHVTTGVPYVVRIYDKHVLAEAQWMWDRVAESIHVLRKLPRYRHVLEMVECFESDASVYILMHLFPSMNLTKMFTDAAAQGELLGRLHVLSRASLRASAAPRGSHSGGGGGATVGNAHQALESRRPSDSVGGQRAADRQASSSGTAERQSFRQLKGNRLGFDALEGDAGQRTTATPSPPNGEERRGSAALFPDATGTAPIATAAAIRGLGAFIPPHIPLVLVRVLFEQAVKGVAFLHQHGVAHTGLAPDHLLVSPEGLLRLGNMVSSCYCAPGERLHELRGTMHTVAPEALRGEAYDPFLSDAWALGVVFYFMLNRGRYPHDGANTLRHILHGHSRPPRPGLPAVALDLLSRLMQARPEDRLPVDAVLAHPFFTATLPTVEEEVAAEVAEEEVRNARPSLRTAYASTNRSVNDSRFAPLDPLSDDNVAGGGGGGSRRWGGRSGNDVDDAAAVGSLTGSWSTSHHQGGGIVRPTTLSMSSSNTSIVLGAGLSSTSDTLEVTVANGDTLVGDLTISGSGGRGESGNFVPSRRSSVADGRLHRSAGPSRLAGAPTSDVADFRSRVTTSANGSSGRGAKSSAVAAPTAAPAPPVSAVRPLWRPELAGSLEALEELAARVIQYHFRRALHRRQYKAETRALMKRSQSVYLTATSSNASSRDFPAPDVAAHSRTAQRGRRPSPVIGASSPKKAATATARTPAASQKHKGRSNPMHASPVNSPAASTSTPSVSAARWPSSVNFHHSTASAGGGSGGRLARGSISSIIVDNRGGSVPNDNSAWEGGSDRDYDDSDGDNMQSYVMVTDGVDFDGVGEGSGRRAGGQRGETSQRRTGSTAAGSGVTAVRATSLTMPSLAATACGNDCSGATISPPPAAVLRGHGSVATAVARVMSNATSTALLSQPGRRRSTISAVLSTVGAARGSFERQRVGGEGAVSDGEVCPLCHREPYAIRSIAIRPYASTSFQYNGGTFTKLLE